MTYNIPPVLSEATHSALRVYIYVYILHIVPFLIRNRQHFHRIYQQEKFKSPAFGRDCRICWNVCNMPTDTYFETEINRQNANDLQALVWYISLKYDISLWVETFSAIFQMVSVRMCWNPASLKANVKNGASWP